VTLLNAGTGVVRRDSALPPRASVTFSALYSLTAHCSTPGSGLVTGAVLAASVEVVDRAGTAHVTRHSHQRCVLSQLVFACFQWCLDLLCLLLSWRFMSDVDLFLVERASAEAALLASTAPVPRNNANTVDMTSPSILFISFSPLRSLVMSISIAMATRRRSEVCVPLVVPRLLSPFVAKSVPSVM
jgi:hypothetical protein